MKKRRLNFKGKVLVTILTIIFSVVIYVLMARMGGLATESNIYTIILICGWSWLLCGQIGTYMMIWGEN